MTVREERQGSRLAAYLVFGIVQIGKELNLRNRHKPIMAHADGETQYRLLVQQRIKNPRRAELTLQALSHAVNAAFLGHILAKQRYVGILQHQVSKREVDTLRQRHRLRQIARVLCKQ